MEFSWKLTPSSSFPCRIRQKKGAVATAATAPLFVILSASLSVWARSLSSWMLSDAFAVILSACFPCHPELPFSLSSWAQAKDPLPVRIRFTEKDPSSLALLRMTGGVGKCHPERKRRILFLSPSGSRKKILRRWRSSG